MGKLEDLNKRLFRARGSFEDRNKEPVLSEHEENLPAAWSTAVDQTHDEFYKRELRRKRSILRTIIGIVSVAVIGGIATFVYLYQRLQISNERVLITIDSPTNVAPGDKASFVVKVKNTNKIALTSVTLTFHYPPEAQPVFGPIAKGKLEETRILDRLEIDQEKEERFDAFIFGKEQTQVVASAELEYRAENSSEQYNKVQEIHMTLGSSSIGIAVSMPEDINKGQVVEVKVSYTSTADAVFPNMTLNVQYPNGFTFLSADPKPSKDNTIWTIGDINPNETNTFTIRGTINGDFGESKNFTARIGRYEEASNTWIVFNENSRLILIRSTLLAVQLLGQGTRDVVARQNGSVTISVNWKNELPVTVKNALIEVNLEGNTLDYSFVTADKGAYDASNKRIIWNGAIQPTLRFIPAGASGTFSFVVRTVKNLPIRTVDDKNFTFKIRARMYTNITPEGFEGIDIIGRDTLIAKIGSELYATAKTRYYEGPIKNYGPLPPKVGQETSYTITWSLSNLSNDLDNVTVRGALPTYVQWKNVVVSKNEKVTFDPDTNEVYWEVGGLAAGIGFSQPPRELSFQISIVPGENHPGNTPQLVSQADVKGHDLFANRDLVTKSQFLTTAMPNDSKVPNTWYRVIE